ncbi:MAG: hypothetical protein SCALA702_38250 [Melioribacteraceae bacterium]|nr:MAG: hypothetical protein SCALA702_38250 [Melioribacteraceae bacterium]
MSNSEKINICKNCGEENPAANSVCDSCGADLLGKKGNKTSGNNQQNKKNRKQDLVLSTRNMLVFIIVLVIAGLFVLIASGTFDEPAAVVDQNTNTQHNHSDNPHGGVDMNSLQKINELQQAYENNPENTRALIDLAHLLNDSGFYEKAIQRYKEYLEISPKEADVWVDMGVCYYQLQQYDSAISAMNKGLEIKPDHQIAHFNLGIVYMASGAMEKAKDWWQKAVNLNPNTNIGKKAQDLLNSN